MYEKLKKLFPKAGDNTLKEIDKQMKGRSNEYIACFLATLDIESAGFLYKEENLNYSESALLKVFGKYFTDDPTNTSKKLAKDYARKPQEIANIVYGGRMGNNQPNDGWHFRGRGYIQLTGRTNYTQYEKLLGQPIRVNPEILLEDEWALKSALEFFKQSGCEPYAEKGDIKSVSGIVNTGSPTKIANHLAERTASYEKILKELKG